MNVIKQELCCVSNLNNNPTNPFTFLEPRNQEIGEIYVVQERRVTDFEAPKLWKGSSGTSNKQASLLLPRIKSLEIKINGFGGT